MGDFEKRVTSEAIKAVWCIDDDNAAPNIQSIDDAAAILAMLSQDQWSELGKISADFLSLADNAKANDPLERTAILTKRLSALADSDQWGMEQLRPIVTRFAATTTNASSVSKVLADVFADCGASFNSISFTEWDHRSDEILQVATEESRILLLVDRTNKEEETTVDGIEVLAKVFREYGTNCDNIDCIIITSTYQLADELIGSHEIFREVRERVKKANGAPTHKVFVLSKERLSQAKDDIQAQLVIHLDRLKASRLTRVIARESRSILDKATQEATDWLAEVSLPEFHWAIFRSSQEEGASEIQTLLRLVALQQGIKLEKEFPSNEKIIKSIVALRSIAPEHVSHSAFPEDLKALRSLEFELPGDHINPLRRPIASGDVFRITGLGKDGKPKTVEAILLGNPCDLVFRKDGKRKATYGLLIPIAKRQRSNDPKKAPGKLAIVFSTGDQEGDTEYVIQPNRVAPTLLSVLDLVWLNDDGRALLSTDKSGANSNLLSLSQQEATKKMKLDDTKHFTSIDVFGSRVEPTQTTIPQAKGPGVDILEYPIVRKWRLTHDYAAAALLEFAQTLSRPAFGHDFTRGWVLQPEPAAD